MTGDRWRPVLAVVVLLMAFPGITGDSSAVAAPPSDPPDGQVIAARLVEGQWTLRTPLGEVTGVVLLVQAADDPAGPPAWRCEVAVAEDGRPPAAEAVRRRHGRGWTVTGGAGGGMVQPWSGPWRQLGAEAAAALGELMGAWAEPTAGRDRVVLRSWEALPASWRPTGMGDGTMGTLRRELTTRGRGRGGAGAVLRLVRAGRGLEITTVRWPATLEVGPPVATAVLVPPEAFLPLWPLADILP